MSTSRFSRRPATAGAPAAPAGAVPARGERVLTFGDVFGRDAGGLIVLLVLFGAMTLLSDEFLTADNLANLARQVAIFGIIAVGQLLVILTAGIDLSVGSVLGLTGCVTAELLVHGRPIWLAILFGMFVGAAIGVFNGSLVAYVKLPPFIVTLGMLGIARGVVLVLTDASTVQPLPDSFGNIANGDFLGLPNLLWLFAVVVAVTSFVLRRTVFGRYVYAVGSNPESARLSGVPVTGVLVAVYAIAGLLAAVGGVLFASRLNAGIPTGGNRVRAECDRGMRDRRSEPVRRQGRRVRGGGRRAHRGHPQQRREPAGCERVLPPDHHRGADPHRRRLRPVAGPPRGRRGIGRMTVAARAGTLPEAADLVDVDALLAAYREHAPAEPVAFGTSGHRGTSLDGSFTEAHVVAISAAVCRYRSEQGTSGPLYLGRDTHALSEPAFRTIVEVLAGHGVEVVVDKDGGATPDAGHLARDPHPQPRRQPREAARRGRHRRHAVAQPARRRRLQVQPAARRPRRHRRDGLDRARPPTRCSSRASTTSRARRSTRRG